MKSNEVMKDLELIRASIHKSQKEWIVIVPTKVIIKSRSVEVKKKSIALKSFKEAVVAYNLWYRYIVHYRYFNVTFEKYITLEAL